MKKIFTVIALIFAVLLTSCSERYNLDELEISDTPANFGWYANIRHGYKEELRDFRYLDVRYSGKGPGRNEKDRKIRYMVFESSSDAMRYFKIWQDYCIGENDGERQTGTNWFISRLPDAYDMIAYTMYYRERNVIIYTDVSLTYYSTENGGTSSVGVSDTEGDQLKTYILENHSELRDMVMEMLGG